MPSWLPPILNVDGEPAQIFEMLHNIYVSKIRGRLWLDGIRVLSDNRIIKGGKYDECFWHLITEDHKSGERLFDPRRAERLAWCGPLIANANDTNVTRWDYLEGTRNIRTYLWLDKHDYVVILEKKERTGKEALYFLITGYHASGSSTKRKLRGKYTNRIVPK